MKAIVWSVKACTLIFLVTMLSECKTYMHFKYGLTQPKAETTEKIVAFLDKYNFPEENQQMFTDSSAYCQAIRNPLFSKYLFCHMIFERNGILLQRDTTQCQWSGYDLVKSLNPDSAYPVCGDLRVNQILDHIQPFGKGEETDVPVGNPDFTVIVTWAKFIGSYNSRLFVLGEAVKQNRTARIRLIWLNVDMLESWNLRPEQKISIR
jgi:hypothetical protein